MKTWIMEVTVHMQMRNTFIYELLPKLSLLINANATLASELEYFMHAQKTIILNKGKIINSWKWAHFEVLPLCIYAHFFNMNWIHLTFSKYTFQVAFTYSPQCYEVLCEWIWKHKHKQGPERCWYLARARIFQCLKIILPLSIFFQ